MVTLLYAEDATLKVRMDHFDDPSMGNRSATDPPESGAQAPVIEDLDPIRAEKIARIKKAMDDGTYHVSAEELADKLIQHMLEPKG
jgi:anti-sigma28 factor (negative regulator of flagellin synthesis)